MNRAIQYLNTDLDLAANCDLAPLAQALEQRGLFALHVGERTTGCWSATFEAHEQFSEPDANLSAMLEAIESLDPASRQLWSVCTVREFNIGYDCAEKPPDLSHRIRPETLARVAAAGAAVGLTLYPSEWSAPEPVSGPGQPADST